MGKYCQVPIAKKIGLITSLAPEKDDGLDRTRKHADHICHLLEIHRYREVTKNPKMISPRPLSVTSKAAPMKEREALELLGPNTNAEMLNSRYSRPESQRFWNFCVNTFRDQSTSQ